MVTALIGTITVTTGSIYSSTQTRTRGGWFTAGFSFLLVARQERFLGLEYL
jgi:hypothetical protein